MCYLRNVNARTNSESARAGRTLTIEQGRDYVIFLHKTFNDVLEN